MQMQDNHLKIVQRDKLINAVNKFKWNTKKNVQITHKIGEEELERDTNKGERKKPESYQRIFLFQLAFLR